MEVNRVYKSIKWFFILCLCAGAICALSHNRMNSQVSINIEDSHRKLKVLSTIPMIGDLVERIGGEVIEHVTLIRGNIDPHNYELVKGDVEKIQYADIVFYNGLGLEHGASLCYQIQNHRKAIALGNYLLENYKDKIIISDGEIDPHVWMDVNLWKNTIELVVKVLSDIDFSNEQYFATNGEKLLEELEQLDLEMLSLIQQIPEERRFLVTSHDAFSYFARRYFAIAGEGDWSKRCAAPEGLAPDGQLSMGHIRDIVAHLSQYKISVIFPESNVSPDSLKKVREACLEKGIEVSISKNSLYGDSVGEENGSANTYMKMMKKNAEIIHQSLWSKL